MVMKLDDSCTTKFVTAGRTCTEYKLVTTELTLLRELPFYTLSSVIFCIFCLSTKFAQVFVRFPGSFVNTYLVLRLDFTTFVQVSKVPSLLHCRSLII